MFEHVPIRLWLLIAIGAAAYAPARYLWSYGLHIAAGRDAPYRSETAGYPTPLSLMLNLAILTGFAILAVFIFTPAAEQLARSPSFMPIMMMTFAALALTTVMKGLVVGRIQPFSKGFTGIYRRAIEPKRFWASMLWNGFFGILLLWGAFQVGTQSADDACYDDVHSPQKQIAACSRLIADGKHRRDLAALTEARGSAYYLMGDLRHAVIDDDAAIRLDGRQSSYFYNRAITREGLGDPARAIADYAAAIRLDPGNIDAYRNRALLSLRAGRLDDAVADYTRVLDRYPNDLPALVNRGIALTRLYDRPRAERDFAIVQRIDPTNAVMLRSAALLALRDGDVDLGLARLNASLESDPTDQWARGMRDQLCLQRPGGACRLIVPWEAAPALR